MQKKITKNHFSSTVSIISYFIKLYKKDIFLLSLLSIVSAIGNGIVPLIAGKMFDSITSPNAIVIFSRNIHLVWVFLGAWIFVQIITSFTDWKISFKSWNLSFLARTEYASRAYEYLIQMPVAFHKTHKISETESKIGRASYSIETIFGRVIIDLAPQFISIIISLIITAYLNIYLTYILIAGIAIYLLVALRVMNKVGDLMDEAYDVWNESYGYAGDVMQNVTAVKQAVTEVYESLKIKKRFKERLVASWLGLESMSNNLRYYQRLVVLVCQITIFIGSITLIMKGSMTIGELIAFNAYSALVFGPFVTLMTNWQIVQNGITNIGKTEETLTLPKEIYSPVNSKESHNIKGGIVFDNVSFHYDKGKQILENINFEVKPGDIVALVGESGVGKSTLVDMISAYHFPTKGHVLVDGVDIKKINLVELRKSIAVVPQEVVLFNDTIKHNITYGNFDASDAEVIEAASKAHALDFILKFPDTWEQMVGERGVKLSVGQKQRVAIARAILRNPKILILDEPTSALDAGSESIITKSLEELMEGKTTFIIAHRLSTVRKADKILVFKEGQIVESGTHEELLKLDGGEYRRLYELQIGLHG